MAKRRACIERCGALVVCSFLAFAGCTTPGASVPDDQNPPPKTEAIVDDPMSAALGWSSLKTPLADQELETIVRSWEDPQVLRVFRHGEVYRAVIADGPHDELRQAAILTIDRVEGLWAVTHVESGRSDLLWPGY